MEGNGNGNLQGLNACECESVGMGIGSDLVVVSVTGRCPVAEHGTYCCLLPDIKCDG